MGRKSIYDDILVSFAFTRDTGGLTMRLMVIDKENKKKPGGICARIDEFLEPNNPFPLIPFKTFVSYINEALFAAEIDNPFILQPIILKELEDE